jgi:hypothetical protein
MQTIVGMFETRDAAQDAVEQLIASGFEKESLGVVMRDPRESADLASATGADDLSAEGATAGAVSGLGVGALIGLALVGSSVLLPGIGPILIGGSLATGAVTAAGTTAAAVTGAGIGAVSGGLLGGLIGAGIPEDDAQAYAGRIEQGHVLVSVRSEDNRADLARRILQAEGARMS